MNKKLVVLEALMKNEGYKIWTCRQLHVHRSITHTWSTSRTHVIKNNSSRQPKYNQIFQANNKLSR